MEKHYNIIIAGAGGIAEAAALILAEWSQVTPTLYIGNRTFSKAESVARWVENGTTKNCNVKAFSLSPDEITPEMRAVFNQGDIILDCLPGSQAPKIAQIAKDYHLHYANLTEYVDKTAQMVGPLSLEKLKYFWEEGMVHSHSYIWTEGMMNWQKVQEIPGLEDVLTLEPSEADSLTI